MNSHGNHRAKTAAESRFQKQLSRNIRCAREQLGLSLAEFGEVIGVSRAAVSQWERGQIMPSAMSLNMMSLHLKIDLNELFRGAK